jgi:cell division protein FtsA
VNKRRERVAVLDIGASALTCMVAESAGAGQMNVAGCCRVPADGWRNSTVVDPEKAIQSVATAFKTAMADAKFRLDGAVVSITGDHIRTIRGKGSATVRRPGKGIGAQDLREVIAQSRSIALTADQKILHVIPIQFIVDGQKGVRQPIDLYGSKLDADVHIIISSLAVMENIYRVVEAAGLRVRSLLLRSIAAALGATTREEREMGVAVMHLGANSEVIVFREGSVRLNSFLSLGGGDITNDISMVLRIPRPLAEDIKVKYGCALARRLENDEAISISVPTSNRQTSRQVLASIIEPRAEEVLRHCEGEVRKSNLTEFLAAGVVLTGGTARLPKIDEMAEQVLTMPVRVGGPRDITGPDEVLANPSYVPAVGLARYAFSDGRDEGFGLLPSETAKNWGSRVGAALRAVIRGKQ